MFRAWFAIIRHLRRAGSGTAAQAGRRLRLRLHRAAAAMLHPTRLVIVPAGRGDDRRIHQRPGLDGDGARLQLPGHRFEQRPVQALGDQRAAEAHEGSALGCRLPRGEAAETAEACAVLQGLGQFHLRQVVPDRQQQRLEHRRRRPGSLALGRGVERGRQRGDRPPVDQRRQALQRRAAARGALRRQPLLTNGAMCHAAHAPHRAAQRISHHSAPQRFRGQTAVPPQKASLLELRREGEPDGFDAGCFDVRLPDATATFAARLAVWLRRRLPGRWRHRLAAG